MQKKEYSFDSLLVTIVITFLLVGCVPYTKGKPISENLPEKQAILVVDMQKDFLDPKGRLPVDSGQARLIINKINLLLTGAKSTTTEIIYIGNEFSPSDRIGNWFRNHAAIRGEDGTGLIPGLLVVNDNYFSKSHPDAFSNRQFDRHLRDRKINELVITGVFADQCVLATVKGALQRGYKVVVPSDGVAAENEKDLRKALGKYSEAGALITSMAEVMAQLEQQPGD
jgi:nicotinamidase-related amidase